MASRPAPTSAALSPSEATLTGGGGIKWFLGPDQAPHAWTLGFQMDLIYTSFTDDLYLTSRTAVLGGLTLEAEL